MSKLDVSTISGPPYRDWDHEQKRTVEQVAAFAATFVLALRVNTPVLPLGYAVAIAALPVTVGIAYRYRGARTILGLAVLAVFAGFVLSWLAGPPEFPGLTKIAVGQASRVLMIGVGALLLLWARSIIGSRAVVMTCALGMLATAGLVGVNAQNAWKGSFALPITLLLLSLPFIYRRAWAEMSVLFGLGLVSATQDARSAAATMLIAGALVVPGTGGTSRRSTVLAVLTRLALLGLGGFFFLQAAFLSGDLGEEVRQRTLAQINTSGSILLGGRPELGATWALVRDQPWGYGIGSIPTPTQIYLAKSGMAVLGYNPDNGYVENYMFGGFFEVHSVIGDLWILCGIAGLVLGLAVIGYVVWGMTLQLSQRVASGALIFLTIRIMWDSAFGPLYSALIGIMLGVAIALPERDPPSPVPRRLRDVLHE